MTAAAVVSAVAALLGIAGVAGVLYAGFKGSANAATIERLREENKDYLGRLNYIEPRMSAAEKQNEVLIALNNPQPALAAMQGILTQHRVILSEIAAAVRAKPGGKWDE